MTRVVIVGEIYNADLSVGGGPMPGGPGWSGPVDPGWGVGGGPVDPGWGGGQRPPHVGGGPVYPGHPANRPPGSWGGPVDPGWGSGGGEHPGNRPPMGGAHPGNRPPGSFPGYPSGGPIIPPEGGTDVPADEFTPPPPPEDISSQYIVSVYDPKTMQWTTKSYPPPEGSSEHEGGEPAPEPHSRRRK